MGKLSLIDQYAKDGYVIVRDVIDQDLVAEARSHIEWLIEKNPDTRPENLDHHLMTQDAFWVRLISDDRLLDIAQEFIGNDIALFASHYIAKPPHSGKSVPWHQDGSYWPLEPMQVITFWLSLDLSNEENGCMKVIPGTQHKKLISKSKYVKQDENSAFDVAMDRSLIDEEDAVNLVLNPGDISIHHPNIFHGSMMNRSDRWRRGLTIRYIPSTTRITSAKPHFSAFILRGEGCDNGNGWNKLPLQQDETSMRFADQERWNLDATKLNKRHQNYLN